MRHIALFAAIAACSFLFVNCAGVIPGVATQEEAGDPITFTPSIPVVLDPSPQFATLALPAEIIEEVDGEK